MFNVLFYIFLVNVMDNYQVRVDFRPLYQCLHIHEILGIRQSFRSHYEENRRVNEKRLVLHLT